MNRNTFEIIINDHIRKEESIFEIDPYDEIKWVYYMLRAIGEVV